MGIQDTMGISYREAESFSEDILRRWLLWAIKGDPGESRLKEYTGNKKDILMALVWVGAIQGG